MQLTIVVPTRNEAENVSELLRRIERALAADPALELAETEAIFVDDSSDDTPAAIARAARTATMSVRCEHRADPVSGLGGAVLEGVRLARAELCLVMDGDLQHPPELVPELYARMRAGGSDVVVASRYTGGGSAHGLGGGLRRGVSTISTTLAKAMFPIRLRGCSDPMTGFFLLDRRCIDLDALRPRGFKILLEVLTRQQLRIAEVPFAFGERGGGASKATLRQGWDFLRQLVRLRFGKR